MNRKKIELNLETSRCAMKFNQIIKLKRQQQQKKVKIKKH